VQVPTRLTLIRHGHTVSNSGGTSLLSGRTDVPLSARGREEVRRLVERLRGTPPFTVVYSSPLQRAYDTAAALAGAGLGPLRACEGLQEIDCGSLDGLPVAEVQRRFPEVWAANMRQDDERFRWPGGESYREFRDRCLRTVRTIAHAHRGARVALVTHAGVVSQLLGAIGGLSPARWERHRPANTALTEVWGRGGGAVLTFDDHDHLLAGAAAPERPSGLQLR
jgi:alpha-ribazole phosphatase/probable phosphoglycerate mutase